MNFFEHKTAAARYARCRPYFHLIVMEHIRSYLKLQAPVGQALDVGCGTGQSAVALKSIAQAVVGTDISPAMLAEAEEVSGIRYVEAPAEVIPLPDASFDLITAGLAFHWFDQDRFLSEAQRLLKSGGWLVIYNNGFSGKMKENGAFEQWGTSSYLQRYPSPPRNSQPLTVEQAAGFGFDFPHKERYENEITFEVEELAAYLTTQSNIISVVEQGSESAEGVYQWLVEEMRSFFATGLPATFLFGGYIWYLQKRSPR